jgi:hypothetical protein
VSTRRASISGERVGKCTTPVSSAVLRTHAGMITTLRPLAVVLRVARDELTARPHSDSKLDKHVHRAARITLPLDPLPSIHPLPLDLPLPEDQHRTSGNSIIPRTQSCPPTWARPGESSLQLAQTPAQYENSRRDAPRWRPHRTPPTCHYRSHTHRHGQRRRSVSSIRIHGPGCSKPSGRDCYAPK